MMSRLSIRARITIGSMLVAVVLLAIALVAIRAEVAQILTAADVTLAEGDLASFEKDIIANPTEKVDDPGTGVLVYVVNPAGLVQVNTLPHDILPLVVGKPAAAEQHLATDDEGRTFVVVGQALPTPNGVWALWATRSTSASSLALDGLDRVLAVGGVLLLLTFGLAAWLLATVALRPVARMRRRAEALETDASDGDLPVGQARDELAKLATTLNAFLGRVRASSAREKRMVSDAAHELRTPLAALKTQLELAHGDFGDAAALALQVRAAEASVDRLSSLAANLLELTRLESHQGPRASSSTSELVSELMGCVDRARMLGLAKSADVGFSAPPGGTEFRYAIDAQSFGRLVDNLFSNSLAAIAEAGSVTAALSQDAAGLTLEVTDDGPGVPSAFLPKAFERFSRPDFSRTGSTGGTGLGLALVRAIAEDAGGTARLHNGARGLVVTVRIPQM